MRGDAHGEPFGIGKRAVELTRAAKASHHLHGCSRIPRFTLAALRVKPATPRNRPARKVGKRTEALMLVGRKALC